MTGEEKLWIVALTGIFLMFAAAGAAITADNAGLFPCHDETGEIDGAAWCHPDAELILSGTRYECRCRRAP